MNQLIDPDLERLGDALRAAAAVDLTRTSEREAAPTRQAGSSRLRPRTLAGGGLGLAGVAAGLVIALGAGGAAASPAFAITQRADGTVLVRYNFDHPGPSPLLKADQRLVERYHETVSVKLASGPATVTGPVTCTPTADPSTAGHPTPAGPPVKLLLGKRGTDVLPPSKASAGNSGTGTLHIVSCDVFVDYPHSAGDS